MEIIGMEISFDEAIEVLQKDGFQHVDIGHQGGHKYVWLEKKTHPHAKSLYKRKLNYQILLVETKNGIQWYVYPESLISRAYYSLIGVAQTPPWGHVDYIVKHSYA